MHPSAALLAGPEQAFQHGLALWRRAVRWQRGITRVLKPLGLSYTQYVVLLSVEREATGMLDGVNQRTLARLVGLDESTVSVALRALEARGLVDRAASDSDIRSWSVCVAEEGERALRRVRPVAEAAAEAFFRAPSSGPEPTSPFRGTK